MNYYILILEEKVKSFSLIGCGEKCAVSLSIKGNNNPLDGLSNGDKVVGYIAGSERAFSYLFDIGIDQEQEKLYFEKTFETKNGAKLPTVSNEIQELINSREQTDSVLQISEKQYRQIICSMINAIDCGEGLPVEQCSKTEFDDTNRIKGGTNIILYGVPGAGKSWTIKSEYCDDENLMERLVFHPDYTYSDFVGQILPEISDDGSVSYVFTPGPFTKLVRKAYTNPDRMFYLVIEEVNRGNAPAIFGDVFQLLDRDKDGSSEYKITNADIARVVYEDESHKVSIPSNMCILCTMNTSDQNVFTLDTAFQRRWNMRLIRNRFHDEEGEIRFANTKILDTDVTWEKFFTEINNYILGKNIRMTSSEDKRLGTHFVSEEDLSMGNGDEKQISRFPEKVLKYLWDDAFKFTKEDVFDLEKVRSLEDVIDLFITSIGNSRFLVFKENIYNSIVPRGDT